MSSVETHELEHEAVHNSVEVRPAVTKNPFVIAAESLMQEATEGLASGADFFCCRKRGREYTLLGLALAREGAPLTLCALVANDEMNDVVLLTFADAMLEALGKTELPVPRNDANGT